MYEVPNATKPEKSTSTRVVLAIGLAVCVAAGSGIAILGLKLATDSDSVSPVDRATVANGRPTTGSSGSGGGAHKSISDPCAPLKTVQSTPAFAKYTPREPKDYTYFVSARCDAQSEKYEVTAGVDIQVNNDSDYTTGAESAGKDYDAAVKVYSERKGGITEVSGVGERAFAAPISESDDSSWHLEVQDGNLGLRITGYTGKGKDADIEFTKQIAQKYLDATAS